MTAPEGYYDIAPQDPGICPACGEPGEYWEDRVSVHDSIIGFEIRAAGFFHPDGKYCTE